MFSQLLVQLLVLRFGACLSIHLLVRALTNTCSLYVVTGCSFEKPDTKMSNLFHMLLHSHGWTSCLSKQATPLCMWRHPCIWLNLAFLWRSWYLQFHSPHKDKTTPYPRYTLCSSNRLIRSGRVYVYTKVFRKEQKGQKALSDRAWDSRDLRM